MLGRLNRTEVPRIDQHSEPLPGNYLGVCGVRGTHRANWVSELRGSEGESSERSARCWVDTNRAGEEDDCRRSL